MSRLRITKVLIFVAALVPLERLVWKFFHDSLGANPIVAYVVGETVLWVIRENVWDAVRPGLETTFGPLLPALAYPTLALGVCVAICAYLAQRGLRLRV